MGCKHSKDVTNKMTENNANTEKKLRENSLSQNLSVADGDLTNSSADGVIAVELTENQKKLIIETWKSIAANISSVGVITFMSLFETHPDVQDIFVPFKGLSKEELRHSRQLRAHGLRVMGFVQKVVERLEEPDKSGQLLEELGRNHTRYGAKADYVDLIGPQFVYAIKPSMEDEWTDEIEEAWIQLFKYMSQIMKGSMNAVQDTQPTSKAKAS